MSNFLLLDILFQRSDTYYLLYISKIWWDIFTISNFINPSFALNNLTKIITGYTISSWVFDQYIISIVCICKNPMSAIIYITDNDLSCINLSFNAGILDFTLKCQPNFNYWSPYKCLAQVLYPKFKKLIPLINFIYSNI